MYVLIYNTFLVYQDKYHDNKLFHVFHLVYFVENKLNNLFLFPLKSHGASKSSNLIIIKFHHNQ